MKCKKLTHIGEKNTKISKRSIVTKAGNITKVRCQTMIRKSLFLRWFNELLSAGTMIILKTFKLGLSVFPLSIRNLVEFQL